MPPRRKEKTIDEHAGRQFSTKVLLVRPVPAVRPGNPPDRLFRERNRVLTCGFAERSGPVVIPRMNEPLLLHLPRDQGARPDRERQRKLGIRWKPALNAFSLAFEGRVN